MYCLFVCWNGCQTQYQCNRLPERLLSKLACNLLREKLNSADSPITQSHYDSTTFFFYQKHAPVGSRRCHGSRILSRTLLMSAVISRCECFVVSNRPRRMIHEHGTALARSNSILGTDVVAQTGTEAETATLTDGAKLRRVAGCVTHFNGFHFYRGVYSVCYLQAF